MKNFIIWGIALELWFLHLRFPLAFAKTPRSLVHRLILIAALGGCLGMGFGMSIQDIVL